MIDHSRASYHASKIITYEHFGLNEFWTVFVSPNDNIYVIIFRQVQLSAFRHGLHKCLSRFFGWPIQNIKNSFFNSIYTTAFKAEEKKRDRKCRQIKKNQLKFSLTEKQCYWDTPLFFDKLCITHTKCQGQHVYYIWGCNFCISSSLRNCEHGCLWISSWYLLPGWVIVWRLQIFLSRVSLFSWRYIRSERSVILINFCLSIISSNALILIGQTQTRNKVTAIGNKHTHTNTHTIHSTILKSKLSLSVPLHDRLFVLLWLLFCTSSFSPPSVGFWRRPGSLIWLWLAVWETVSYANASSAWDGVSSVCLLYI